MRYRRRHLDAGRRLPTVNGRLCDSDTTERSDGTATPSFAPTTNVPAHNNDHVHARAEHVTDDLSVSTSDGGNENYPPVRSGPDLLEALTRSPRWPTRAFMERGVTFLQG